MEGNIGHDRHQRSALAVQVQDVIQPLALFRQPQRRARGARARPPPPPRAKSKVGRGRQGCSANSGTISSRTLAKASLRSAEKILRAKKNQAATSLRRLSIASAIETAASLARDRFTMSLTLPSG
jgi:hypothetical protein